MGRGGERHPLEPVVKELRREFGDIDIELTEARGREFVDQYLDTEPNNFDVKFRDTFFKQTRGHALFTVELLRGMQEQGTIEQDEEGCWIESLGLDWGAMPVRVEAVID
jgi:hypothetical protein